MDMDEKDQALRTVVIATRNKGKVREFASLFEPLGLAVRSLNDYADLPEVVEDGETFADNAFKKASEIAALLRQPVLADDSGLCVDVLGGEPGVYSARYSGENATDDRNNRKLLKRLAEVREEAGGLGETDAAAQAVPAPAGLSGAALLSSARFVCALVLYDPADGTAVRAEQSCEGYIIGEPRGESGFGYDPLFYVPELGKTFAELTLEEKNKLSHRAKAMRELVAKLASR